MIDSDHGLFNFNLKQNHKTYFSQQASMHPGILENSRVLLFYFRLVLLHQPSYYRVNAFIECRTNDFHDLLRVSNGVIYIFPIWPILIENIFADNTAEISLYGDFIRNRGDPSMNMAYINPFSARTDFIRLYLTSVDGRSRRIKTAPALKELKYL